MQKCPPNQSIPHVSQLHVLSTGAVGLAVPVRVSTGSQMAAFCITDPRNRAARHLLPEPTLSQHFCLEHLRQTGPGPNLCNGFGSQVQKCCWGHPEPLSSTVSLHKVIEI